MRGLQALLALLAAVQIATGAATLLFGDAVIGDPGALSASSESELRFYGTWWLGAGIFVASLIPRIERAGRELAVFSALLFLGGGARVIGVIVDGRPATVHLVLMGLELGLPPVLLLWQRHVASPRR